MWETTSTSTSLMHAPEPHFRIVLSRDVLTSSSSKFLTQLAAKDEGMITGLTFIGVLARYASDKEIRDVAQRIQEMKARDEGDEGFRSFHVEATMPPETRFTVAGSSTHMLGPDDDADAVAKILDATNGETHIDDMCPRMRNWRLRERSFSGVQAHDEHSGLLTDAMTHIITEKNARINNDDDDDDDENDAILPWEGVDENEGEKYANHHLAPIDPELKKLIFKYVVTCITRYTAYNQALSEKDDKSYLLLKYAYEKAKESITDMNRQFERDRNYKVPEEERGALQLLGEMLTWENLTQSETLFDPELFKYLQTQTNQPQFLFTTKKVVDDMSGKKWTLAQKRSIFIDYFVGIDVSIRQNGMFRESAWLVAARKQVRNEIYKLAIVAGVDNDGLLAQVRRVLTDDVISPRGHKLYALIGETGLEYARARLDLENEARQMKAYEALKKEYPVDYVEWVAALNLLKERVVWFIDYEEDVENEGILETLNRDLVEQYNKSDDVKKNTVFKSIGRATGATEEMMPIDANLDYGPPRTVRRNAHEYRVPSLPTAYQRDFGTLPATPSASTAKSSLFRRLSRVGRQ